MAAKTKTVEATDHAERLKQVFGALEIKRATFVDDQFSPQFADAWAATKSGAATKGTELLKAWGLAKWSEQIDDDEAGAQKKWDGLGADDQAKLVTTVRALVPGFASARPTDIAYFADYWPTEACSLEEIGPERFDASYIKGTLLGGGPSLLFLDLSLSDQVADGGVKLLQQVLQHDDARKTVCVILTAQAGAEEPDFWDKLAEKHGVDPSRAVVISKKATHALPSFERDLRRALLNSITPGLVSWASEIATEALRLAVERSKGLEGDVINAVVLRSSENEGVDPTETLFRLVDEEVRRERDALVDAKPARERFSKHKAKLAALAKIAPDDVGEPALPLRAKKLMRRHLYRAPAGEWPTPIWLGDLWDVTLAGEKERTERYVLVAQPCDLMIRTKDGKRSQDGWVVLVPVLPNGQTQETMVQFPYFDEGSLKEHWAHFKKARIASADVLDAVALAGAAIQATDLSKLKQSDHVQPAVRKRLDLLGDWLDAGMRSAAPALTFALFAGPGPVAKVTASAQGVEFHCRRTGRVDPELSRLLLQRYGNYLSRHALPHDFASYEKE